MMEKRLSSRRQTRSCCAAGSGDEFGSAEEKPAEERVESRTGGTVSTGGPDNSPIPGAARPLDISRLTPFPIVLRRSRKRLHRKAPLQRHRQWK
jgi:hypothetical protein